MTPKEAIKILDGMEYMALNRSPKDVQSAVILAINALHKADDRATLRSQLAEVTAERDAAVEDLKEAALEQTGIGTCVVCKWGAEEPFDGPHCGKCTVGDCKFEWRGKETDNG